MSASNDRPYQRLAEDIVTGVLHAYFGKRAPDRMIDDVLYDFVPPGHSERNYTVRLFLKPSALTAPAIMLKGKGPSYLAAHSLNDIAELLRKFVYRSYPIVWRETKMDDFDGSLYELVSASCRSALAETLEKSSIFR